MNKRSLFFLGAAVAAAVVLFAACENPADARTPAYTVTFNANGGSPAPAPQTVAGGGTVTKPDPDPAKSNYTFGGWYSDAEFAPAARWDFDTAAVSGSITLHAKWELPPGIYSVTFNTDGGSPAPDPQTVAAGGTVTKPAADPVKNNYTFGGWYSDAGCTTRWDFDAHIVTGALTLYAWWKPDAFTSISDAQEYLAAHSGGGSASAPVTLPVNIPLSAAGWSGLLAAIGSTGKYVNLDLTRCAASGDSTGGGLYTNGTFDPDYNAGAGKDKIVSLTLPDAATGIAAGTLSNAAFKPYTSLKSISGANVASIGNSAFYYCTALASANFPAADSIGNSAFYYCTSLAGANFPAADSIGNSAFYYCTSLAVALFPAADSIGDYAFSVCSSLAGVEIPQAASIGNSAFSHCTSLAGVSFPKAASIGDSAFSGCTKLAVFTLTGNGGDLSVAAGGKALARGGTELLAYPTASGSITMDGITSIGDSAFAYCTGLAGASFPQAAGIGYLAFYGCTKLENVNFPAATSIGDYAFQYCASLAVASFPAAVSIGSGAFQNTGSAALTLTLGNTAPTVGTNMFYGVTADKAVTVKYPAGGTGYGSAPANTTDSNWGNALRGKGWTAANNTYSGGAVNSSIILAYQTYAP